MHKYTKKKKGERDEKRRRRKKKKKKKQVLLVLNIRLCLKSSNTQFADGRISKKRKKRKKKKGGMFRQRQLRSQNTN